MSHYAESPPEPDDRAMFDMADAQLTLREMRWICPFCTKELRNEQSPCCGEVGHAEPMPDDWED